MPLRAGTDRRIQRLNAKTDALFKLLGSVELETLLKSPSPGYWNALEALNHIYLGEHLSLQYVRHKLKDPGAIPKWRPDAFLRTLMLKWVLWSPIKVKSPKPINMQSGQPVLGLPELQKAWKEQREGMSALLEEYETQMRFRLPYKQPYAGRLTFNQMLIFFEDHLDHHHRQIERILEAVSK